MANSFSKDVLIQAPDPKGAASFYVDNLGFEITEESINLVSLHGKNINMFIERGPTLGPVFEIAVDDLEAARLRLMKHGSKIVKDEPKFPRSYLQDPFGLIYNLTT
jgi:predicted enzyme related to lactoylglutathione lyase